MSAVAALHEAAVSLALCKPDYDDMAERCPEIMEPIETALDGGVSLETVTGWIERNTTDEKLCRQLCNAARWYRESKR